MKLTGASFKRALMNQSESVSDATIIKAQRGAADYFRSWKKRGGSSCYCCSSPSLNFLSFLWSASKCRGFQTGRGHTDTHAHTHTRVCTCVCTYKRQKKGTLLNANMRLCSAHLERQQFIRSCRRCSASSQQEQASLSCTRLQVERPMKSSKTAASKSHLRRTLKSNQSIFVSLGHAQGLFFVK